MAKQAKATGKAKTRWLRAGARAVARTSVRFLQAFLRALVRGLRVPVYCLIGACIGIGYWSSGYFWDLGRVGGWIDRDHPPEVIGDVTFASIAKDLIFGGTGELLRGVAEGGKQLAEKANLKDKDPIDTHGYAPDVAIVHVADLLIPGTSLGEADRWIPQAFLGDHARNANLLRGGLPLLGLITVLVLFAELVATAIRMVRPRNQSLNQ